VLLTRVLYRKRTPMKEFLVVDAGMNDLIRPALYQSHHEIIPLRKSDRAQILADVVDRSARAAIFWPRIGWWPTRRRGSTGGLHGGRLRICAGVQLQFAAPAAEVLVSGDQWRIIRSRESLEDLVRGEISAYLSDFRLLDNRFGVGLRQLIGRMGAPAAPPFGF